MNESQKEELKEVRLKQLQEVTAKIEKTTDPMELMRLEATGRFLMQIIEGKI